MIAALKSLTSKAEVHVAKLGAMKRDQLVGVMGQHSGPLLLHLLDQLFLTARQIVIGLHSDELMSALWMPVTKGSTVIELFEEGGFTSMSATSRFR